MQKYINNELYKLKEIKTPQMITTWTGLNSPNTFVSLNDYNYLFYNASSPGGSLVNLSLKKFDKTFNFINNYHIENTIGIASHFRGGIYVNGKYYFIAHANHIYVFHNEINGWNIGIECQYCKESIEGIAFFKGYYFIVSQGTNYESPYKITRYKALSNGDFDFGYNDVKEFDNDNDFKNVLENENITHDSYLNPFIIDYAREKLLLYFQVGKIISFDLNNLISENIYNPKKPYIYAYVDSEFDLTFSSKGGLGIIDNHYVNLKLFHSEIMDLITLYVYNEKLEKVSMSNLNLKNVNAVERSPIGFLNGYRNNILYLLVYPKLSGLNYEEYELKLYNLV